MMLAGEVSQESRHIPLQTRELCGGQSSLHEPMLQILITGFPLAPCQRLRAIRLSPLHPSEAASHRHEQDCHAEGGDKLPSVHSITSLAHDPKASGIVGPIDGRIDLAAIMLAV
jgi:hypothetical protein